MTRAGGALISEGASEIWKLPIWAIGLAARFFSRSPLFCFKLSRDGLRRMRLTQKTAKETL